MTGLWAFASRERGRVAGTLTLVGVSLSGGVAHNLGQLAAASLYVGPAAALTYLGPLMLAGLVSGYVVGRPAYLATGSSAVEASFARLAPG